MDLDYAKHEPIAPAQPVVSEAPAPTIPSTPRGADGKFAKAEPTQEERERAIFEKHVAAMRQSLTPDALPASQQAQPEDAKADKADAPKAEEPVQPSVDKEALAAALQHAKRYGIPKSALDKMSPQEIIAGSDDWAKRIKASDDVSRKLADQGKLIEELRAKVQEPPAAKPVVQPDKDFDALVQPFVADFDDGTRDSLKGIAKVAREYADSKTKALEAQLAESRQAFDEIRKELDGLKQARGAEVAEQIRGELKGVYPSLGEKETWNAVLARAEALLKSPDYQADPRTAIEHAAKIECASFTPPSQVSESGNRSKRNGVASTATQAARGGTTDAVEAYERKVFEKLLAQHGRS